MRTTIRPPSRRRPAPRLVLRLALAAFAGLGGLAGFAGLGGASAAAAERHERWEGDIHRFNDHDWERWHRGRWYHGRHGGRLGWWWIVGGVWYFYPQPIYPYPDPYVPPGVVPAPPVAPPPPPAAYYYCDNPRGYYPYVPACRLPWRVVPR